MLQQKTKKSNKVSKGKINHFFESLLKRCKEKGVYSVIEIAQKMGVSYDEVQNWANTNKNWKYALEMSRCHCSFHAQTDWDFSKISDELGLKYCLENDDELAERYKNDAETKVNFLY